MHAFWSMESTVQSITRADGLAFHSAGWQASNALAVSTWGPWHAHTILAHVAEVALVLASCILNLSVSIRHNTTFQFCTCLQSIHRTDMMSRDPLVASHTCFHAVFSQEEYDVAEKEAKQRTFESFQRTFKGSARAHRLAIHSAASAGSGGSRRCCRGGRGSRGCCRWGGRGHGGRHGRGGGSIHSRGGCSRGGWGHVITITANAGDRDATNREGGALSGVVEDVFGLGHDLSEAEDGLEWGGGRVGRQERLAAVRARVIGEQVAVNRLHPFTVHTQWHAIHTSKPAAVDLIAYTDFPPWIVYTHKLLNQTNVCQVGCCQEHERVGMLGRTNQGWGQPC